jgi:uncharacterized membrane protein YeaQ/YmgE (transglycosylase-associated protein family)
MFGAIGRGAVGFAFGALIGAVIAAVISVARPIVVSGLSESHEIVGYMDAFATYWILVVFVGALLGVLAAGISESSGSPV